MSRCQVCGEEKELRYAGEGNTPWICWDCFVKQENNPVMKWNPSPFAALWIIFLMVMILAVIIWLTFKVDVWGLAFQFALMA